VSIEQPQPQTEPRKAESREQRAENADQPCCSISCSIKTTSILKWLSALCLIHAFFIVVLATYKPQVVDWRTVAYENSPDSVSESDTTAIYFMYFGPSFVTLFLGYAIFSTRSKFLAALFAFVAFSNLLSRVVAFSLAATDKAKRNTPKIDEIALAVYSVEIVLTALEVMFGCLLAQALGRENRSAVAPVPSKKPDTEQQPKRNPRCCYYWAVQT